MVLDYPSILFFLALNNVFIILLFIYQYFYHHKQWYLLLFAIGIALQNAGIVIYGKTEVISPLLSTRIVNLLLILSILFTSFGLLSFDGRIRKKVLWTFIAFGLLSYTIILLLEYNKPMITVVRILVSLFFYGSCAYFLFTHKNKYKTARLTSGVLLIYIIFQAFRAYHIFQAGESYDFYSKNTIDNWYLALALFIISATSIGFIMLLKEIDEKTILQKNQIIEKDKLNLKQLNETQNKLFSIIAHDLRSPFNNILVLSSLLKEDASISKKSDSKNT